MPTKSQKSVASDATFQLFGLVNLSVDLVAARTSESRVAAFTSICPACPEPVKVNQYYSCPANHGPFTTKDLVRKATQAGEALIEVSAAEMNTVKTGSAEDTEKEKVFTELAWFQAETVEANTRPGELAYRLRPGKSTALPTYLGFRELLRNRSIAFVGTLTMRKVTRMFRLEVWGDQIFAQSLLWPDDLAERDEIVGEFDSKALDMLAKNFFAEMPAFDPSQYRNAQRERAEALVAAKIADPEAVVVAAAAPVAAVETPDLLAALTAMLAAKDAKPAKKKAAPKRAAA